MASMPSKSNRVMVTSEIIAVMEDFTRVDELLNLMKGLTFMLDT